MIAFFWLRYALRSLRRSGTRGAFALACVAVGVAGVVALQTATLTIQNALTSNVRAANGGDISVASQASPLSSVDLNTFQRLQASGRIGAWTAVSTVHATAVGTNRRLIPFDVNIVSSPPYPLGGQPTFVSPSNGNVRALLNHSGDVLATSVLADELGVASGSRILVNGIGGSGLHATVRGVLAETSFEHSAVLTVNARDAAALGAVHAHYTAIYVVASNGIDKVARTLRARFPAATIQTVPEALNSAQLQVHDFRQFMLLVGLLALLIAGVGILNAMQSMLAQRRLEIAMLKAIGFQQGTLYALFGVEAFIIGLLGGVVGTAAGALASRTIADALARALAIQITFLLDAGTLMAGIGLGIGAALVFATLPIVRAAALRPIEILREGAGAPLSGWWRTLVLVAAVVLLFVVLASITLGNAALAVQFVLAAAAVSVALTGVFAALVMVVGRLGPQPSWLIGVPVLLALIGLSLLLAFREPALAAIAIITTILWAATVVLPRQVLLPLLIAARSLSRRRMRTSVTLVAFLAGVLAMTITVTVALSLQRQINDSLSAAGSVNLVAITNPAGERALSNATHALPGVQSQRVTTVAQTNPVAINGRPLASVVGPSPAAGGAETENDLGRLLGGITGWNLTTGATPGDIRINEGRSLSRQDAGTLNVLMRDGLRDAPYSLKLGDQVTLRASGTSRSRVVMVVGFYSQSRRGRAFGSFFTPPVLADRSLVLGIAGQDAQAIFSLSVTTSQLSHDATTLQRSIPGILVVNVGDLTGIVEKILNQLLNLLAVITALVLGAGVAVVANGVGLAMLERRREIAVFKAIGFAPSWMLRFVLIENALLGTLAGAVGILITAIALGVLSHLALRRAIGFDPLVAVIVLVISTGLAVFTAYLTARRPMGVRPIEALRNE